MSPFTQLQVFFFPLCFYMEVLDNTEQLFACLWSRVIIMLTLVNKRFYKH